MGGRSGGREVITTAVAAVVRRGAPQLGAQHVQDQPFCKIFPLSFFLSFSFFSYLFFSFLFLYFLSFIFFSQKAQHVQVQLGWYYKEIPWKKRPLLEGVFDKKIPKFPTWNRIYFQLSKKNRECSKIAQNYLFGNVSEQILSKIRLFWSRRFLQGISL